MNRKDYFYKKAKKEKYPARSVYKLEEIDRKYRLVKKGMKVLDLGCSPGSWVKYCCRQVGEKGLVVGIDKGASQPGLGKNVVIIQEDIFEIDRTKLKQIVTQFDLVLSDLAPATTGTKWLDQVRSLELARQAFNISLEFLVSGGNFLVKLFQGPDLRELQRELKRVFQDVRIVKPKGSRKESFEIYLLGLCRKGESTFS